MLNSLTFEVFQFAAMARRQRLQGNIHNQVVRTTPVIYTVPTPVYIQPGAQQGNNIYSGVYIDPSYYQQSYQQQNQPSAQPSAHSQPPQYAETQPPEYNQIKLQRF